MGWAFTSRRRRVLERTQAFVWSVALLNLACGRVDYPDAAAVETDTRCDEGSVVETLELCGQYVTDPDEGGILDFNRVLEGCRDGVRERIGCTCGAEQADKGPAFRGTLELDQTGTSTDLSHALCIAHLIVRGPFPALPNVTAINGMYVADAAGPWSMGALRRLGYVSVRRGGDIDFRTLGPLVEVGGLDLAQTGITSLQGLEGVNEMAWVQLRDNDALQGLSGLKNLEYVEAMLRISPSPDQGLRGLEKLRSVGMLDVPIRDEADLEALSGLKEVRGDLSFAVATPELWCAAQEFLARVNVEGTISVSNRWELDGEDCEGE